MNKQQDIVGVILAAGKGTRFKSNGTNKTANLFLNKPLIQYGIDLYKTLCSHSVVVVGAYADSVINAVKGNDSVIFASQKKRLGTGHAMLCAIREIQKSGLKPRLVLLGYGDHMMYYKDEVVRKLVNAHTTEGVVMSLVSTNYSDPMKLAWGRIVRDKQGHVTKIVEQKDASEEEKKISEVNAGFYCFNYDFLVKNYKKLQKSEITGEYYITDFVHVAQMIGKNVKPVVVPFKQVGLGINTKDELEKSQALYQTSY